MNTKSIEISTMEKGHSVWDKAWYKFKNDGMGKLGALIVLVYFIIALAVWFGFVGGNWSDTSDALSEGPSMKHWFGTNQIGQDIFARVIFSTKVAFEVGLVVAIFSTLLGSVLGSLSGYYSGTWVDSVILWLMGVLDSIPFYLFVAAVAYALKENPFAMHIAMISTFWTGTARVIRGEVIKLKGQEFVEAARSIGVVESRIIFKHITPNTSHILLVQATIVFVAAIKSEVILSFLGMGVKDGVSWGLMISESTLDIQAGYFNNFIASSMFMFVLVIAFNMFSDSMQDALDPKKVS
ncbi:MAG TPA: ABC transporter permease [Gammaproteobacteria bacterium]|nr:ABC transporter permease [Xanthomonadales bacterium]MCB1594667.1 ABC transporter permease [Xanthomonadales bacterium]HOP21503.1 ABC transporter permease [Gammaproteobacteria bacterium]HPI94991.1 ABC transporter permease [Gammaproteobacteria bacterium]HPQ86257.1 ABC transporter permease [Gammaproteobacteria bacterium]